MLNSEQAGELVLEDTAAVLLPEASAQLCINCFEVILTMVNCVADGHGHGDRDGVN